MSAAEPFSPPGAPSDEGPAIRATGRNDISTLFTSMSARDPDDAEYLQWHTLDHRPEQYRLDGLRASLRVVSTRECRAARAASEPALDATDHVMTYFFNGDAPLQPFFDLAVALRDAGRMSYQLPAVERGVYTVKGRIAAPRVKLGADVLPWWPARGIYLLVESGSAKQDGLTDVGGVAGLWHGASAPSAFADLEAGQQITYLFLDGDPVETAERLKPVLQRRWERSGVRPLLAAPFYTIVPHEWDRYVPQ